nr:putative integron gene cassette protein [uncultured bacterium]
MLPVSDPCPLYPELTLVPPFFPFGKTLATFFISSPLVTYHTTPEVRFVSAPKHGPVFTKTRQR